MNRMLQAPRRSAAVVAAMALCAAALLADATARGAPAAPDGPARTPAATDGPARTPVATVAVRSAGSLDGASYDGVVQAVRQTTVGAQVPGAVVAIEVRAGDAVKAGQVLLRLDARAADQLAAAGAAQVLAARAAQDAA